MTGKMIPEILHAEFEFQHPVNSKKHNPTRIVETRKTIVTKRDGTVTTLVRKVDDLEAEAVDPYAMGYDAGSDMENPPPCPFKDGVSARLWRAGFSARVDEYIANLRRWGGLNADISKLPARTG